MDLDYDLDKLKTELLDLETRIKKSKYILKCAKDIQYDGYTWMTNEHINGITQDLNGHYFELENAKKELRALRKKRLTL